MIYLYVKTHNKTGLKYLGKTIKKDPHKYTGSGVYWKKHLKKYGCDYTTEILFSSENILEIKTFGLFYSMLWDVVESEEWANLTQELGEGSAPIKPSQNRKKTQKEIELWKKTMVESGKLGKNNPKQMVATRRLKDNFKSNRDPEVIRKQNETKLKNGTTRKGKKLPPHILAKRIGSKWYNNGIVCKRIFAGDIIPEGFFLGKIHRKKIKTTRSCLPLEL